MSARLFAIPLCILMLAGCGSGDSNSSSASPGANASTATDAPTDSTVAPQAPPDRHSKRAAARDWYLRIINPSATTRAAIIIASDEINNGDTVDASAILKKASEQASQSLLATEEDAPAGWDDVKSSFQAASAELKLSVDNFHDFLDNQVPSKGADAKEHLENYANDFMQAVHQARVHYIAMGGKGSDLSDGVDLMNTEVEVFRSMESSNNQSSSQ